MKTAIIVIALILCALAGAVICAYKVTREKVGL